MPEPIWYRLRLSRASPPGRASQDQRRRALYGAGLQQFEEMINAARAVGPATRPLQLYYALTQAGRAIAAAQGNQQPPPKHGLTLRAPQPDLMQTVVAHAGSGEFQAIARIVGSGDLTAPVELGALWCALPDLWATPLPNPPWPRPLGVVPERETTGFTITMSSVAKATVLFGERLAEQQVGQRMALYPSAGGWRLHQPDGVRVVHRNIGGTHGVVVEWTASGSSETDRIDRVNQAAPEYRFHDERWLRPALGTATRRHRS